MKPSAALRSCCSKDGLTCSPEVREEALQVMRVAELFLALVGSSYQAAPGRVQLGAFLLNVILCLGVRLDEALRRVPERIHLHLEEKDIILQKTPRLMVKREYPLPYHPGQPSPSQSLHACAAGPEHWPGRVRSCQC